MVTSLDHLLPAPDQSPRCADHSRALAVDPGGSAIRADRIVLVETPLPWPKPVFSHPRLTEIEPILKKSNRPTRLLAFVSEDEHRDDGIVNVVVFDRSPTSAEVYERRYILTGNTALEALVAAIASDDFPTMDAMAVSHGVSTIPAVLICTQGSHDVCCGSEGARFAAEVEQLDQVEVYRVSHTGGHRFAPTALTLPDGRMWSDMDLTLLRQVLSRTGSVADVVDRCRGWWGAATGPAQVAERAVFEQVGWAGEQGAREVAAIRPEAGQQKGLSRYVVTGGTGSQWEVRVGPGRVVPTIACRQPGGQPAKQGREYIVEAIRAL